MADALDLTGNVAAALDGAALRGNTAVLGYIGDDGYPALSFRGSAQVYSPTQIAVWSRKADEGIAAVVGHRPNVSLLYFGGASGPGARFLSIQGQARVDPSASEAVYANMLQGERDQDPEAKGVAIVIDVESVRGLGPDGPISMARS